MAHIQALIDSSEVNGTGNKLYVLIMVNQDDSEDTTLELWRADSEDHLYDQVAEEFYDGEDPDDFMGPNFEEEIWGMLWLPKFLGTL
jgi:hypothetical protein